ncbi:hypothetical protein D3C80_1340900 [compost metagenome]
MFVQGRGNVDRLLNRNCRCLLASTRGILRINITVLQTAVGIACCIADDGQKQRTSKPLPPMRIDMAVNTGTTEHIRCGRGERDNHAFGCFCPVPQHEQPLLAALKAATILPNNLRPLFHQNNPAIVGKNIAIDHTARKTWLIRGQRRFQHTRNRRTHRNDEIPIAKRPGTRAFKLRRSQETIEALLITIGLAFSRHVTGNRHKVAIHRCRLITGCLT